jgi:hypothetical protein
LKKAISDSIKSVVLDPMSIIEKDSIADVWKTKPKTTSII